MAFKLNLGIKKSFHAPDINRSIAARNRRRTGLGVPKLRVNKGLAPVMPRGLK